MNHYNNFKLHVTIKYKGAYKALRPLHGKK